MSNLAAQLLELRRQAGAQPQRAAAALPSPLAEQLRRLLGTRAKNTRRSTSIDRDLPGPEIAPGLRLLEQTFDWPDAPETIDASFADFGRIPRQHLMSFDTETTGLAGGTGTRAFMIGAADWPDQRLRVRQLFLTEMRGEPEMLRVFSEWLRPETVLVSYNGRCFDSPLLMTRYRLARQTNPLAGLRHLDLLFPIRRRYRGVWENCRLVTIERNLLGILREDDLPGSEAPRAWQEYLQGGSAADLRRVIAHNHQDLTTLGRLLIRLSG